MVKRSATPIRFDMMVSDRLAVYIRAHPGLSLSSAANRFVDEGLRMSEHPGVVFRDGPTGRRAGLAAGPDVWEIVRSIKSARAAEPALAEQELLTLIADNTGTPVSVVHTAVRYWASYPNEIDDEIATADAAEEAAELAWQRERRLLAG
jgi:hypothetical protein